MDYDDAIKQIYKMARSFGVSFDECNTSYNEFLRVLCETFNAASTNPNENEYKVELL